MVWAPPIKNPGYAYDTNQDLLLVAITHHSMPQNTDIQTHWPVFPSAVEIARSDVVAKREISIMEKNLKIVKH